jgi:hypothetical protein
VEDKLGTKITLSEVASLQQLIEQAPTRSPTEVTKREAIGLLAPKLYEMHARGYAWRDVAAWLTEHGSTVTVSSLQRRLRGAKRPAADRRGGRAAGSSNRASRDGRTSSRAPLLSLSDVPATSTSTGTGQRNVPVAGAPPRTVTARTQAQDTPRSGFVPRPDTKEI